MISEITFCLNNTKTRPFHGLNRSINYYIIDTEAVPHTMMLVRITLNNAFEAHAS